MSGKWCIIWKQIEIGVQHKKGITIRRCGLQVMHIWSSRMKIAHIWWLGTNAQIQSSNMCNFGPWAFWSPIIIAFWSIDWGPSNGANVLGENKGKLRTYLRPSPAPLLGVGAHLMNFLIFWLKRKGTLHIFNGMVSRLIKNHFKSKSRSRKEPKIPQ